jgi:hypothetical protein
MSETTFALVSNGVVQQLLTTGEDISKMFAPGLQWIKVSDPKGAVPGYRYDGVHFTAPTLPDASAPRVSLDELRGDLRKLEAAFAAFEAEH